MHSILPFVSKPQKRNPGYGTGYGESQSGGVFLSYQYYGEKRRNNFSPSKGVSPVFFITSESGVVSICNSPPSAL